MLLPLFAFQVTKISKAETKKIKWKSSDDTEHEMEAKKTVITLAELPYTDIMELKKIHESTLIWYTGGAGGDAGALVGDLDGKATYAHCTTR